MKSVLKYGLPPYFFVSYCLVGVSINHVNLMVLDILGIPYPRILAYWHLVVPAGCALLWLATLRRWPVLGGIGFVLLCVVLLPAPVFYVQSRIASIPVTRWLTQDEQQGLDAVPIRICQQGLNNPEVIVSRENEERAREEIKRLGLLRYRRDPPPPDQ
jgi:hypothetical protein